MLYDFSINSQDTVSVGWNQHLESEKDTALFVVVDISNLDQFGKTRKQITLAYAEEDEKYSGHLHWVEGIGSLEHPFYPFALLDDDLKHNYELLCLDSAGVQSYQNPNYQTCDTSYTSINEIETEQPCISPNPFKDQIRVQLNTEKILDVKVYDISGREIPLQWTQNTHFAQIQILEEGFYGVCLLQIHKEDGVENYKLLRQK